MDSRHRLECDHGSHGERVSDCDHILYGNGHHSSRLYIHSNGNGNGRGVDHHYGDTGRTGYLYRQQYDFNSIGGIDLYVESGHRLIRDNGSDRNS